MIAATATTLTRGRVHGRVGRGSPMAAHAAPNKGSAAGAVDTLSSLANSKNDNGQNPIFSSGPGVLGPVTYRSWSGVFGAPFASGAGGGRHGGGSPSRPRPPFGWARPAGGGRARTWPG